MVKSSLIFLLTALAIPAVSLAQSPNLEMPENQTASSTQPAQQGMRRPVSPGARRWVSPSDEEWPEVVAMMAEISPNGFKVFEQLDPKSDRYRRFRDITYFHYRMLLWSRSEDPALYQVRVDRLKLEDQIFGMVKNIKPDEAPPPEMLAQLQTKVGELVDLNARERQVRIERMEKMVANEKQKLQTDVDRRNEIIDGKIKKVLSDGGDESSFGISGGPDGRRPRVHNPETQPAEAPPAP